jgi:hypothetical protein
MLPVETTALLECRARWREDGLEDGLEDVWAGVWDGGGLAGSHPEQIENACISAGFKLTIEG